MTGTLIIRKAKKERMKSTYRAIAIGKMVVENGVNTAIRQGMTRMAGNH